MDAEWLKEIRGKLSRIDEAFKRSNGLLSNEVDQYTEDLRDDANRDVRQCVAEIDRLTVLLFRTRTDDTIAGNKLELANRDLLAENTKLREALTLVLPLAKGYAAAHRVGSNGKYVEMADRLIHPAVYEEEGGEPATSPTLAPRTKCVCSHDEHSHVLYSGGVMICRWCECRFTPATDTGAGKGTTEQTGECECGHDRDEHQSRNGPWVAETNCGQCDCEKFTPATEPGKEGA